MATEKVTGIRVDAVTGKKEIYEYEREVVNPRIFEIQQRLQDIRMELAAGDYKAIKYAEGATPEEEYAPVKAARQALRAEYNKLEAELAKL
jgi:hypothetical protein